MLYPIGLQNFEDLRNRSYVYVDKTRHIYNLAADIPTLQSVEIRESGSLYDNT